jgi:hypothetical protein
MTGCSKTSPTLSSPKDEVHPWSRQIIIGDIESFLIDARAHRPDNVLIMITNTLSSDTKDWLDAIRKDYPFKIICWEELDLEREVALNRSQISERFPKIT